jgi:dihydrofolate reductase
MRKLKLQVQMTVDGYIAGLNGEMDWTVRDWDAALNHYVAELTTSVDCILLGRKLAQGFIPYWASHPQEDGAQTFNSLKKVVFTKTLDRSEWDNTILAKGDLLDEITALKQQPGQDLIAYGGAAFVSTLIQNGLIDEYHLFINPAAIGSGLPIFHDLQDRQALTLVRAISFACGIVILHYVPQRA